MNIRPPGVKASWVDCDVWTQAMLLGYSMIRDTEE